MWNILKPKPFLPNLAHSIINSLLLLFLQLLFILSVNNFFPFLVELIVRAVNMFSHFTLAAEAGWMMSIMASAALTFCSKKFISYRFKSKSNEPRSIKSIIGRRTDWNIPAVRWKIRHSSALFHHETTIGFQESLCLVLAFISLYNQPDWAHANHKIVSVVVETIVS